MKVFSIVIIAIVFFSTVLIGQDERPVLESTQRVFVIEDGERVELEKQDAAKPGDILLFENTYINTGNDLAKDMRFDVPIPEGMHYIDESAECIDAEILFSIDNGQTFAPPPITYSVMDDDGNLVEKVAIAPQYTDIRYLVSSELHPGESLTYTYSLTISRELKEE